MIIRKYNEYKHENDMLVEKIEEAKRLEGKMGNNSQLEIETISASIEELSLKKSQIQKNHSNQLQLSKKLDMIIKICQLNRMYGSETDFLSNYLENLKKMITNEEIKIKEIKDNIQDVVHEGKITLKQIRNKKKEIKGNKDKHALTILASDSNTIRCTGMTLEDMEDGLTERSRSVKRKHKKTKTVHRKGLNAQDH